MNAREPQPGLMIQYSYLWRDEARRGQEEGVKDRPCVIIGTQRRQDNRLIVSVFPITHTPQGERSNAVEISAKTRARLGLDERPYWIVTTEGNQFTWPGFDVRPVPGKGDRTTYAYGYVPEKLFDKAHDRSVEHARDRDDRER